MTTKSNFEKLTKKELIAEVNGLVSEVEKLIADNEKDYFKMHKDVSVLRSEAGKQKDIVAELGRKLKQHQSHICKMKQAIQTSCAIQYPNTNLDAMQSCYGTIEEIDHLGKSAGLLALAHIYGVLINEH